MIKSWMLLLLVSIFSFQAHSYTIISDLDDTIKITHSERIIPGAINGVFSFKIFSGIQSYLHGTESTRGDFYIVTASPDILKDKVKYLLKKYDLKIDGLYLRKNPQIDKLTYKVDTIKTILEKSSGDVILIGDDVGKDPEAYEKIRTLYPDRVKAIYIRPILNRAFSGTRIHTTLDLALSEMWANRINIESVLAVFNDHLRDEMKYLVPKFAWCPGALSTQDMSYAQVSHRLKEFCQNQTISIH